MISKPLSDFAHQRALYGASRVTLAGLRAGGGSGRPGDTGSSDVIQASVTTEKPVYVWKRSQVSVLLFRQRTTTTDNSGPAPAQSNPLYTSDLDYDQDPGLGRARGDVEMDDFASSSSSSSSCSASRGGKKCHQQRGQQQKQNFQLVGLDPVRRFHQFHVVRWLLVFGLLTFSNVMMIDMGAGWGLLHLAILLYFISAALYERSTNKELHRRFDGSAVCAALGVALTSDPARLMRHVPFLAFLSLFSHGAASWFLTLHLGGRGSEFGERKVEYSVLSCSWTFTDGCPSPFTSGFVTNVFDFVHLGCVLGSMVVYFTLSEKAQDAIMCELGRMSSQRDKVVVPETYDQERGVDNAQKDLEEEDQCISMAMVAELEAEKTLTDLWHGGWNPTIVFSHVAGLLAAIISSMQSVRGDSKYGEVYVTTYLANASIGISIWTFFVVVAIVSSALGVMFESSRQRMVVLTDVLRQQLDDPHSGATGTIARLQPWYHLRLFITQTLNPCIFDSINAGLVYCIVILLYASITSVRVTIIAARQGASAVIILRSVWPILFLMCAITFQLYHIIKAAVAINFEATQHLALLRTIRSQAVHYAIVMSNAREGSRATRGGDNSGGGQSRGGGHAYGIDDLALRMLDEFAVTDRPATVLGIPITPLFLRSLMAYALSVLLFVFATLARESSFSQRLRVGQ